MNKTSNKKVFYCTSFKKCALSGYLGNNVCEFFKKNGFVLVKKSQDANIIIINTCAFDQYRENKAVTLAKYFTNKYLSDKQIIILGCYTKIGSSLTQFKKNKNVILIGPKESHLFNKLYNPRFPIEKIRSNKMTKKFCEDTNFLPDDYYIQISQGCSNNCAYCAIKKAKGNVKSKPAEEIINEFKIGLKKGYKRFILLADDCGSYGFDYGSNFANLLNEINKIKDSYKLFIYYLEPSKLEFLFPKIDKVIFRKISSIRIPIQSTSQRIIKLMNRKYDVEKIFKIIKKIKKISPKTKIRTQIIYGYPTETRKEFMEMIEKLGMKLFDEILPFCYSDRKGTPASKMKGKISAEEKEWRSRYIETISQNKKKGNYIFPYGEKNDVEEGDLISQPLID